MESGIPKVVGKRINGETFLQYCVTVENAPRGKSCSFVASTVVVWTHHAMLPSLVNFRMIYNRQYFTQIKLHKKLPFPPFS